MTGIDQEQMNAARAFSRLIGEGDSDDSARSLLDVFKKIKNDQDNAERVVSVITEILGGGTPNDDNPDNAERVWWWSADHKTTEAPEYKTIAGYTLTVELYGHLLIEWPDTEPMPRELWPVLGYAAYVGLPVELIGNRKVWIVTERS